MTVSRTTVLPGDRVVARGHAVVLVCDAPAVGAPLAVGALVDVLAAPDTDPMTAFAHVGAGPAFAAVTVVGDVARVRFGGAARGGEPGAVTVAQYDGAAAPAPRRTLTAADGGDHELSLGPDALVTVTVGPPPVPSDVCGPTALHLLGGAVPGRGAVLWTGAPEMAGPDPGAGDIDEPETESMAALPGAETDEREMFDKTDLDLEAITSPATGTGPLVPSVRCAFGHPNAPGAAFCRRCGGLVDRRAEVVSVPRPPLGLLMVDDGQTFVLAADVVLGREPDAFIERRGGRSFDGGGPLLGLRLQDRTSALSRAHVELRLDGWQVLAVDAGSANGTWLRPPGAAMPMRLPAGQPVPVPDGAALHIGGRVVVLAPLTTD